MKKEHLAHFNIAGFTYYNGAQAFKKLKVGKKVSLKLEQDNRYDPRAIAIYYKKHKLGYIPRSENRFFYKLIKVGLSENIKVRIQQVDSRVHPEEQIQLVAHLINKTDKY